MKIRNRPVQPGRAPRTHAGCAGRVPGAHAGDTRRGRAPGARAGPPQMFHKLHRELPARPPPAPDASKTTSAATRSAATRPRYFKNHILTHGGFSFRSEEHYLAYCTVGEVITLPIGLQSKSLGNSPRRQSTFLCALRIQTTLGAKACTIHDGDR